MGAQCCSGDGNKPEAGGGSDINRQKAYTNLSKDGQTEAEKHAPTNIV